MTDKYFFTNCFTEWKSGKLSSPLLKCCEELISHELISQQKYFYKVKDVPEFSAFFYFMCYALFEYGVRREYALVLIAFILSLDTEMLILCDWYTNDLVINLFSKIFEEMNVF